MEEQEEDNCKAAISRLILWKEKEVKDKEEIPNKYNINHERE